MSIPPVWGRIGALVSFLLVILLPISAKAQVLNCFPTCTVDDSRMIVLQAGDSDFTLGNEPIGFILVSEDPVELNWGLFDADAVDASRWDADASSSLEPQLSHYSLYADPARSGDINGPDGVSGTTDDLVLVTTITSSDPGAIDNDWYNIVTPQDPAALSNGLYTYLVVASQEAPLSQGKNNFKVRVDGAISLAGNQTISFQSAGTGALDIIYPNGTLTPTTYDGNWEFNFLVTSNPGEDVTEFILWDGDLDHGDGSISNDTDDADTPNTIPAFNTSAFTVAEGAQGAGAPPDNIPSIGLVRGDAVTIEVVDPQGNSYINANPSGTSEWEKFEIRRNDHIDGCDATLADFCVDRISPGVWTVNVLGMDISNVNFYRSAFESFPPSAVGGIGNYVWVDENGDGLQDAGEPGIAGVTVRLFNSAGIQVGEAITDSNGGYYIKVALPDAYTVEVVETTLPFGLIQTQLANEGADFGNQQNPYAVTLGLAEINLTADFGYNWGDSENNTGNGAIGDTVWVDTDGDGMQDLGEAGAGESGLGGVTVTIYSDSNGDGVIEPGIDDPYAGAVDQNGITGGSTQTNPDGLYVFSDLPPDAYIIVVDETTLPVGYVQTGDPDAFSGSGTVVFDHMTTHPVVLEPGDAYLNADFGYQPDAATVNSIGDTVFLDANVNGVQDAGEIGFAIITLELLNENGESVATTVTDTNGLYLFDGLSGGTYTVVVTDTNGILTNFAQAADPDGIFDSSSTTTVNGGVSDLDQDFGYVPNGHQSIDGLVGDTVFLDRNANGLFDAGEGFGGVTVNLYDPSGTVLIDQTTTNSNGVYFFGKLDPAGTYIIEVDIATLPADVTNTVDPDGGNDSQSNINLAADPDGVNDGVNLDQDFGYVATAPGVIGDLVWIDANADGINDGPAGPDGVPGTSDDEPGVEGVTLDLYLDLDGDGMLQAGEPKLGATQTDSNGLYTFTGLPGGDYIVDVTDEADLLGGYWHSLGVADTNDNSQADPYAVTLPDGGSVLTADFGYHKVLSALGDRVWFDADADGIQEVGEPGIGNVELNLTIDYSDGTQIVLTSFTDDNGIYTFANLLADEDYNGDSTDGSDEPTFTITVVPPTGLVSSPIDQGGDDSIDSDDPNGELGDVGRGQNDDSNDFGFFDLGSISGNVSEDTDRDGTIDAPLSGVTVELFEDADRNGIPDSGTPVDTTTTDADGNYGFADVQSGSYLVVEIDPTGYESLSDGDVTIVGDDDFPPANDPTDDNIIPVTVTVDSTLLQAEDDDGNNFVDSPLLAGLGDTVWFDHNANGLQDAGEDGIPSVTVNLLNSGGAVIDTTVTDGTGFYEFTGLTAETYTVQIDPASFTTAVQQTFDLDDGVTTTPVTANSATVTLTPGETNNDVDFGYRPLGTIGDTVWNDDNANGIQDGAELGIEGVDVILTGPVNDSATTTATGFYEFTDLPAGTYTVTVSGAALDGLQQTHDLDDPVTTSPATADTANVELALNATSDAVVSRDDVDFGYRQQGVISGTVEEDTDGDGAGDAPQQGVTIELYADTDGDGNPDGAAINTTTTDVDGNYSFADIPPGDYVVVEVNPTGFTDVSDQDTTPDGDAFDDDTTVDSQVAVTLGAGEADDGNDFVDERQGSISGTVTEDTTGDGAGDTPQENVTVELYADTDGDGNPDGTAIDSTTTAADGSYSFDPVSPGQYVVVEVQPAGLVDISDDDATPEDTNPADSGTAVDNQIPATVEPGEADADNNFVDANQGGITGTVTEDTDGDGVGDTPIQGVIVELFEDTNGNGLFDTGEPSAGTTTSGADGSYSFVDLMPGDYVVVETQPANLVSVSDQDEDTTHAGDPDPQDSDTTIDDQVGVQLNSGETDAGNNFVEENQGSISGSVLEDTDGDGVGDSGQDGVTVELFEDANGNGVVDPGETVVDTTTTGADGSYQFDNVSPGDYVVVPVQSPDLVDVLDQDQTPDGDVPQDDDATVDNSVGVGLDPGEDDTGNNFVDENQGSISGTITEDTTGDGAGDTPQAGVTVTLYEDTNGNGVLDGGEPSVDTTTTGADGSYQFDNVSPGDYVVVPDQPAGLTDLLDQDQSPDGDAQDADSTVDNSVGVTVEAGESDSDNNFIDVNQGGISGSVTEDTDGDGVGDTPIQGVTITLYEDTNSNGTFDVGEPQVDVTSTGADGSYSFADLMPGDYMVVETQPDGLTSVSDQDESPDGDPFDSDATVDDQIAVTLETGESDAGNNFVEENQGSISGSVLEDTNGDGVGDTGQGGVTVTLYEDTNGNGVLDAGEPQVGTTTTGADGSYSFDNVSPGDYVVIPDQGAGLTDVSDQDQSPDGDAQDTDTTVDNSIGVGVEPGEADSGNDFVDENQGSISGTVTEDTTGNGLGDTAQSGVTVTLYEDTNGNGLFDVGEPQVDSTTTGADGSYSFDNVSPGNYVVVESQPSGLTSISDQDEDTTHAGDPDPQDSDTTVDDGVGVSLNPGEADSGNNFVDQNLGSIGDFVWNDINMDGVQDAGELGIGGVTLSLFDTGGQLLSMTTTASDGSYQFVGFPAGDYTVTVTDSSLPLGFLATFDLDGIATEHTASFTLAAGESRTDVDFGYAMPMQCNACSGKVDSLSLRYQGSIANANIVVVQKNGDTVFDGIVQPGEQFSFVGTDASKQMTFGTEIDIFVNGVLQVTIHTSCSQPIGPGAVFGEFLVVYGTSRNGGQLCPINDIFPGLISGTVTEDTNADGVGDTALSGVTVELYLDSDVNGLPQGTPVASTTTGADGSYLFSNVNPADYVVVEVDPAGYVSVSDSASIDDDFVANTDTNDNFIPVTVTSNESDVDNNFVDEQAATCPAIIDFDTASNGSSLAAGTIIDDEFSGYGITVSTNSAANPAMIFDSSNPTGGDNDLGTPNTDFGGPGIGAGGASGTPGENAIAEGNILIISEDGDSSDPDDNAGGGTLIFDFAIPYQVASVTMIDIESSTESYEIRAYDAGGALITTSTMQGLGNNSREVVNVNAENVSRLEIDLSGSGGVANIDIVCPDEPSIDIRKQEEGNDSRTFAPGDTVDFEIAVTNTGAVDLTNVEVSDPEVPACDNTIGFLAAGQTVTYTCSVVLEGGSSVSKTWLDNFSPAYSYSGNDGNTNFLGNWTENDPQGGGASSGRVLVGSNYKMWMNNYNYPGGSSFKPSVQRAVDMSGTDTATLSFDWITHPGVDSNDAVALEVSTNGGSSFTQIDKFWGANTIGKSESFDVSAYITSNTIFRFRVTDYYGGSDETFKVDNFKIVATGSNAPEGFVNIAYASGEADGQTVTDSDPSEVIIGDICVPEPSDSVANGQSYSIWIDGEYFSADSGNTYSIDDSAGSARYQGSVTSNSNGTTYAVDMTFSGFTTTPPAGSPKLPSFSVDASNWVYYTDISGSVGPYSVSRRGPAYQVGYGANMNDTGYGASGWMYFTNGSTTKNGDINIKLTDCEEPPVVCEECVNGYDQITLKVSNWTSGRDQNETVRVREGGLGGTLLFEGQVANGQTFTFDVNNPGTTIVVTVQGNSHPSEYVKGTFLTDCDLYVNKTSGNSYITFKVTALVGDSVDGDCSDPTPPIGVSTTILVNKQSGLCLDNNDNDFHGDVYQKSCNGSVYQEWELRPVGDYYEIVNKDSNLCLDVEASSTSNEANVMQYTCNQSSNKLWDIVPYNGYYQVIASHSNKCLEAGYNGQNSAYQYTCDGWDGQLWDLTEPADTDSGSTGTFSANVLSNGGFESGYDGWWKSDNYNDLTIDSSSGFYAIKINKTASRGMTSGVSATQGDVFKLSAMAKVTGDGWAVVSLEFKDSNYTTITKKQISVENTSYQLKETGELTAPAGTSYVQAVLWVGSATYNSYLYVDEVSLQKKQ